MTWSSSQRLTLFLSLSLTSAWARVCTSGFTPGLSGGWRSTWPETWLLKPAGGSWERGGRDCCPAPPPVTPRPFTSSALISTESSMAAPTRASDISGQGRSLVMMWQLNCHVTQVRFLTVFFLLLFFISCSCRNAGLPVPNKHGVEDLSVKPSPDQSAQLLQ